MSDFRLLTACGHVVDLLDPDPATIDPRDIIVSLSCQRRYLGHGRILNEMNGQREWGDLESWQYTTPTVAEHSAVVAAMMSPALWAYGLLHDAHEAYLGDIIRPVRRMIEAEAGKPLFVAIEGRLDRAIWAAFGLEPIGAREAEFVRAADMAAYAVERTFLLRTVPADDSNPCFDWGPPPTEELNLYGLLGRRKGLVSFAESIRALWCLRRDWPDDDLSEAVHQVRLP